MLVDALRTHRIKVALDDFGAGASWFSYLKSFPVDYMKIDGQFTRDLLHDPLNRVALRCFRELAASVGAETIVESVGQSVGHDLQRDALLALGFDLAQGYLLHRPELLARLTADGSVADGLAADAVADVLHAAVFSSGTRAPLLGQLA